MIKLDSQPAKYSIRLKHDQGFACVHMHQEAYKHMAENEYKTRNMIVIVIGNARPKQTPNWTIIVQCLQSLQLQSQLDWQ